MGGRIRREEVLRYLGHTGQTLDSELDQRLDWAIDRCERLFSPRFVWRVFNLEGRRGARCFGLNGTTLELEGNTAASFLEGARFAALLACTLGHESERELRVLGVSDPLGQILCDAACSDLVETGVDDAVAEIERWACERGLYLGSRFSPGYGDLNLNVQPKLLSILNTQRTLGLTCTDAHLLTPSKSVTACIGLFPEPQVTCEVDACADCPAARTCEKRRRGTTCGHRPLSGRDT